MTECFFVRWVIAIIPGHYPTTLLAEFTDYLKGSAQNNADLPRKTFLDKRISSDNRDKFTYIFMKSAIPNLPATGDSWHL